MPGSIEPARVAIGTPSSGVQPIVVSTERPSRTAVTEHPLPRWQTTSRRASEYTIRPLNDPEFNRAQAEGMRDLLAPRMRDLPSADFAELLRSAMREDEWLLVLHGAVLGFAAGCVHLAIFGVG